MSMNQFETDEQRAEALVEWLKKKGPMIILGVVLGFSTIGGWYYYKSHQAQKKHDESAIFAKFYNGLENNTVEDADYNAVLNQSNETYKTLAALNRAQMQLEKSAYDEAKITLTNAIALEKDTTLLTLLNFRLAKIYYEQKAFDESLALLDKINSASFKELTKDLSGDIFVKQGKIDAARIAYEEAWLASNGSAQLIQRKLDHLGGIKQ